MKIKKIFNASGPVANLNVFIFITNIVYTASVLLEIYKYNPEFFFENAFQLVNIVFYLFVLLSFFLVRNTRFYFLSSFFLVLDLPISIKFNLQNLISEYLHINGPLLTYILLFCILGSVIFIVFKYRAVRYLQVYLFLFYPITLLIIVFKPVKVNDHPLRISTRVASISKNYYFLLFDEYPNEQIIRNYNLCSPPDYPSVLLGREGFESDRNVYANFANTEKSTVNFLTGSFQDEYSVSNAIHAIYKNSFTGSLDYSFHAFSLFDNQNRPNSEFSTLYFKNFNNLSTRKLIPFLISLFNKRGVGKYTDWDNYNADAVSWLNNISKTHKPHVVYIHFFTPHVYPGVWGQSFSDRIKNANGWMQKAIQSINHQDPEAGVIIFSDHGLRVPTIPVKLWNRNMLYFRNIHIDTNLVNKRGLVDLTKSIKY